MFEIQFYRMKVSVAIRIENWSVKQHLMTVIFASESWFRSQALGISNRCFYLTNTCSFGVAWCPADSGNILTASCCVLPRKSLTAHISSSWRGPHPNRKQLCKSFSICKAPSRWGREILKEVKTIVLIPMSVFCHQKLLKLQIYSNCVF